LLRINEPCLPLTEKSDNRNKKVLLPALAARHLIVISGANCRIFPAHSPIFLTGTIFDSRQVVEKLLCTGGAMGRSILTLLLMQLLYGVISDPACAQTGDGRVQPYSYVGVSLPSPEGVGLGIIGGGVEVMVHKDLGLEAISDIPQLPIPLGKAASMWLPLFHITFGAGLRITSISSFSEAQPSLFYRAETSEARSVPRPLLHPAGQPEA
jgi:hypothetical protein